MKTKKLTLTAFINHSNIPPRLIRAVVNQLGGFEEFQQAAQDITNHGISGGFGGFIYYTDTVAFSKKHKADIMTLAEDQARDYYGKDADAFQMIAGFNCLKGQELSPGQIAKLIHGREPKTGDAADDYTQLFNALAWYAGEEVARAWCDFVEYQNENQ